MVLGHAALVAIMSATIFRPAQLEPWLWARAADCGWGAGEGTDLRMRWRSRPGQAASARGQSGGLREWKSAMRSHIAIGLEYIGQCALCGIFASSTPLALSFVR